MITRARMPPTGCWTGFDRKITRFGGFFSPAVCLLKRFAARRERFEEVALIRPYLYLWYGQMSVSARLEAWHTQWGFQAGAVRCRDCNAVQAEACRDRAFAHDAKCQSAQAFGYSPWDDLDRLLGNPAYQSSPN